MSWNKAWEPYSRHQYPSVDKAEGRWHNSRTDRRGRYDRRPVACQPRHHDSGDRGGTRRHPSSSPRRFGVLEPFERCVFSMLEWIADALPAADAHVRDGRPGANHDVGARRNSRC